jgi:hypothetical protein
MTTPIVYCETNWIVALAFPHHQLHREAAKLREDAQTGNCRLRIPMASLLEARGTLGDVANQLAASFASLRNALATGSMNGLAEFSAIARSLQSDVVDRYTQRNTLSILDDIEADPAVGVLHDVTSNFKVLRELRAHLDFRGKDIVDLHLLASIVKDRRENPTGPALLVSHNKKEFDPRRNKVPEALYDDARLLWRGDFDLPTGVGQWNSKFGAKRL